MANRLTDDQRAAILADIEAGLPRNEIARKHKRAPATITDIAQTNGLEFDRSATKSATEASVIDGKARRAALIPRIYALAEHEIGRLEALNAGEKYRLVMGTGSGRTIDKLVTTAPEKCRVEIATQYGIHLDKAKVLEQMDSGQGEGKSMIEQLFAGLASVA